MKYFIKTHKEIIGLFNSVEDCEIYALNKLVLEHLKFYRHNLLNDITMDEIKELRIVENLMEDITNLDIEDRTNIMHRINVLLSRTKYILDDTKYKLDYVIEHFKENTISIFYI